MRLEKRILSYPKTLRDKITRAGSIVVLIFFALIVANNVIDLGPYQGWIKIGTYVVGAIFFAFAVVLAFMKKRD